MLLPFAVHVLARRQLAVAGSRDLLHMNLKGWCVVRAVQIRAQFCRYRASQIAAACIMAAQRVWQKRCGLKSCDWGPRLSYYSGCTREDIAPIADSAMAEAADVSAKVIAGQQPPPAVPDPSGPSRVDQDVGSFTKRYCIDFVTMIHADLGARGGG